MKINLDSLTVFEVWYICWYSWIGDTYHSHLIKCINIERRHL